MQDPTLDALGVFLKQQALCSSSSSNGSKDAKQQTARICSLLCCSTDVAGIVHAACRGTLTASLHVKQQQEQCEAPCRWLAKHAQLLRCLHLTLEEQQPGRVNSTVEDAVTDALKTAAAGPVQGSALPLAELHCRSPISGRLLGPLSSSSSLTSLTLTLTDSKRRNGGLSASLAALTALQTLTLTPAPFPEPNPTNDYEGVTRRWNPKLRTSGVIEGRAFVSAVSSGLSGLSQLTRLQLAGWTLLGPDDVAQLPVSLRSLSIHRRMGDVGGVGLVKSIGSFDAEDGPEPLRADDVPLAPLNLSPLSNLTQLALFQLCPWDRLPVSLHSLDLDTPYQSLDTLTALTQLQELKISNFYLAGIGDLPELADKLSGSLHTLRLEQQNPYKLRYNGGECVPWPSGWIRWNADSFTGLKPLKELRLSGFYLQPGNVLGVLMTTSLTHLSLTDCCLTPRDTHGEMYWSFICWLSRRALARYIHACARGLRRLKALQGLELELEIQLAPAHMRVQEVEEEQDSSDSLTEGSSEVEGSEAQGSDSELSDSEWSEDEGSEAELSDAELSEAELSEAELSEDGDEQLPDGSPAAAAGSSEGGAGPQCVGVCGGEGVGAAAGGSGAGSGGSGGAGGAGKEAEGDDVTAADVQPMVDAIASLRPGLGKLRVWIGRGLVVRREERVLLLTDVQMAQLQLSDQF